MSPHLCHPERSAARSAKRSRRTSAITALAALLLGVTSPRPGSALPSGFVYLSDVAPSVVQDMRYAGYHNFIGKPIEGYDAPRCILTREAAAALAKVQRHLETIGLTLRVYDCYRPQRAVNEFIAWGKTGDTTMKAEFYPDVNKADLFKLGYIDAKSGHSRGSTVDLTIERLPLRPAQPYAPGDALRSCTAPFFQRYRDGSIDMGTGYDCMDPLSHPGAEVGAIAGSHRLMLASVMEAYGFKGIKEEWWHFTLRHEPFPKTYFNFPVR